MSHVTQDGEHEDPGGEAGAGVDHAGDQSVAVAVVVELVVRPQGWQSSGAHTVGEEYLRGSVYPGCASPEIIPLWSDVVQQARPCPLQRHGPAQQHRQYQVGGERREPDYLPGEGG